MNQVQRRSVFITGVSSGFGYFVTKALLKKNYLVIASLRGGDARGKEIFAEYIEQINNKQLILLDMHLDQKESLRSGLEEAIKLLPDGLDVLINNAGYGLLGPVELQDEEQVRLQFETNFFAPLIISQKLLPSLRKKQGRILNLSSLVGFNVFPYYGIYSASKHAIDCLTEALYYDIAEFKVQVCAVEPGGYKTNFSPNTRVPLGHHPELPFYQKRIVRFNKFLDFVQSKIEKDPMEVVNVVVRLCEKKSIPVRVRVGTEAHINWLIKKISPDQWRIKIQDWIYRKFFF